MKLEDYEFAKALEIENIEKLIFDIMSTGKIPLYFKEVLRLITPEHDVLDKYIDLFEADLNRFRNNKICYLSDVGVTLESTDTCYYINVSQCEKEPKFVDGNYAQTEKPQFELDLWFVLKDNSNLVNQQVSLHSRRMHDVVNFETIVKDQKTKYGIWSEF